MERAGRVLRRLKVSGMSGEDMARSAWPAAVGKRIAACTERLYLNETRLVVEVEDAVWQQHLTTLTPHILKRLDEVVGPGIIVELEFRTAIKRRTVQRAEAPAEITDEADRIADPVLRRVYISARRKASA
jgi:hypothetical protein